MQPIATAHLLTGVVMIAIDSTPFGGAAQTVLPDATPMSSANPPEGTADGPSPIAVSEGHGKLLPQAKKGLRGIVVVVDRYQASSLQMRSDETFNVLSAQYLARTAVHDVTIANRPSSEAWTVPRVTRARSFRCGDSTPDTISTRLTAFLSCTATPIALATIATATHRSRTSWVTTANGRTSAVTAWRAPIVSIPARHSWRRTICSSTLFT